MTRHRLRIQQLTLIIRSTLHTTIIPNNQPQPADRHAALFRALLGPDLDPDNATRDQNINMTNQISLTDQEKQAQLDLDQLEQLVGLVYYDQSNDPFPVNGWDAIVFVVGNATQAASYYQSTRGSTGVK
jgi:hypothetical protein